MERSEVYSGFRAAWSRRLQEISLELESLAQAMASETKSSAGDKYETAREMIGQARALQESLAFQAREVLAWLELQEAQPSPGSVRAGAVVETSEGWFLVGPLSGSIEFEGVSVAGLTAASPLGAALKGGRPGESRRFRERDVQVVSLR